MHIKNTNYPLSMCLAILFQPVVHLEGLLDELTGIYLIFVD